MSRTPAPRRRRHDGPLNADESGMSMHGRNDVWLVGSDDIRLRIPFLLELRRRGLDVTMVGSEPPEPFIAHEIPYHQYSLSRALDPLADWRTFREVLALFRKHRPSVVHAFDTKPAIIASFAARR